MPDRLEPRLQECHDVESVLACALSRGLELSGTALGNVQLMDWSTGCLTIAAQRGFSDEFLSFFHRVTAGDGSACGRAIRERRAVVVTDVLFDPEFAPCRIIAIRAGFRAVQSTPLISSSGAFVGVLSTHFPAAHRPTQGELKILKRVGELTANAIIRQRACTPRIEGLDAAEHMAEQVNRGREAIRRSYELMRHLARKQEH